jgi:hypothetical protein
MLLVSATPKQVEAYLGISNAEEELISLERDYTAMQNGFSKHEDANDTYDMQLLSIRFHDYLQRNLSEDEMDEILQNYTHVVLLQFISASQEQTDENASTLYIKQLKDDEDASERIALITDISEKLYSKEGMTIMFDGLMKPLITAGIGGDKVSKSFLKDEQEAYVKSGGQEALKQTLYFTREFSIEELNALYEIAKNSATQHEGKAVYAALAYALKDFFLSMASRYDVSKH